MTATPAQIDHWLTVPSEHENLEFKEAKTQFDHRKLYRYCVAIANEGGGHLVLGVSDAPPRRVVGSRAFPDLGATAARIFEAVRFRVQADAVPHPDGRVVVFGIPARPRGTAYAHEGAYLMRVGEELHPLSEDRLRAIFGEGTADWLNQPSKQGLSTQDIVALLDTQTFFDLLNQPYPTDQAGVIERLQSERLIDRDDEGFTIRNLAALLLAKELRSFDTVYRKAPRVVAYVGDSKLDTRSDLTGAKGYAVGFQGLVKYVMTQLPQNEVIEDALRKQAKLLPEVVIRELLANALIHQDFDESGMSPLVEIYAERTEISNPGLPLVPVDRFIDGYQSRNERLADLMRRFGICEEKSSGVDRVVEAAELHQLPAPDFLTEFRRTSVIIHGPKPFAAMDRTDRIRACYQHCCLLRVLRRTMSNQSLRDRFGLADGSSSTASAIIAGTLEAGLIKLDPASDGSKKFARYVPAWA